MTLFKGKYRVESTRLKGWDYTSPGYYYITIITRNREMFFGHISNDKIIYSETGKIANVYWQEIPVHFPHVEMDKYIVMPNHVHGLLKINTDGGNTNGEMPSPDKQISQKPAIPYILHRSINTEKNINPFWKPGNLGVIINQYKRICTIKSRKTTPRFGWQTRFHDHIIRDEDELNRIRQYIILNPLKWNDDRNFHS
ncbi:MAG: transposase [Fibrobacteria bacterium]|nr:transposase [Fibrobacteria bacterium]